MAYPVSMARAAEIGLVLRALAFAAHKHRDQRRKGSEASPYINHPITVADVLVNEGGVSRDEVEKMRADWRALLESEHELGQTYKPNKADWFDGRWQGLKVADEHDDARTQGWGVRRYRRQGGNLGGGRHVRPSLGVFHGGDMLENGMKTPIQVRHDGKRHILVEGLHRLEAAKWLGETEIDAYLVQAKRH